ncbi:MAG: branched-chain amino acid aminotransferase [Actinomycetota bacterium]
MAPVNFLLKRNDQPATPQQRAKALGSPGFGQVFTDHMVQVTWTEAHGWHDARVLPYGPLSLDPSAAVFHYGQEIFEGLKAYRHADGSVWAFRPEANAARFARSAHRLALPELAISDFLASIRALVEVDEPWVPDAADEKSLYLRPFMFASEAFLGVRPAREITYCVIASPAGAYFAHGVHPVSIWLSEDYTRAAPGGTGAAKCGGNYAASLAAQVEAAKHGCEQVCFLDVVERRWVEELGGMNLFFVLGDGTVVTPPTSGSILEGVTRSSIIELIRNFGHDVAERPVDIAQWREGAALGEVVEVFACGTAAVVTPVGRLVWSGGEVMVGGGQTGPLTAKVRSHLVDIQYGRQPDSRNWLTRLV